MRFFARSARVKTFVWSGNTIAEERDYTGATVKKRFFAEGEQRIGGAQAGNYYYTRDHLGSVREVTDATGALKGQYDYDAWGKSVVVKGNMHVDFGYTGYYFHQPSGLNLALYRAYSPTLGRWISRDPVGEIAPWNLYSYCSNDPLNKTDPMGLLDLNLYPRGELVQIYGDRTPLYNDKFTAGGHGAPDSMLDSNGNEISVEKLGDMIKANPTYDPKKPVELDSCQTGRDLHDGTWPYAQRLANYLGSTVIAPTANITFDENGKVEINPQEGYFKVFLPINR